MGRKSEQTCLPLPESALRSGLVRAGLSSLAIKIASVALGLVLAIVLARALGASAFGQYSFVFAVVTILAIPVQLGLPQLVVRETARADQAAEYGLMRAVWRWAHLTVGALTLVAFAGALLVIGFFGSGTTTVTALIWGLLLLPLIALGNVRGAALRGLGRVIVGQAPDSILRPLFFILLIGGALLLGLRLHTEQALMLHVVAAGSAFAVGAILLARSAPPAEGPVDVRSQYRGWTMSAGILGATAGLMVINSNLDLVMLGILRSEAEVGVYKIAATGASLVAFGLQAITVVMSPRISRLYAAGKMVELQDLVTSSARFILLIAAVAAAFLLAFGDQLLAIAFGEAYRSGYAAMSTLVAGQVANAAFGSVGTLLNMSGHERDTFFGVIVAAAGNILLNVVLIPPFGIIGAAVATSLTLLIWNLLLWQRVRLRLGISSTAIALRRR